MIINCGKRRLCIYAYGWKIEIERQKQETGEKYWSEDRPAWPATLEQGLEMICERELKDMPDVSIHQLPDAIRQASAAVRRYMELARKAA